MSDKRIYSRFRGCRNEKNSWTVDYSITVLAGDFLLNGCIFYNSFNVTWLSEFAVAFPQSQNTEQPVLLHVESRDARNAYKYNEFHFYFIHG